MKTKHLIAMLLALVLCVMQSAPAFAQGFIPPSGGGSGPPPVEKLTTADVFSDWLVSGCVPSFGSVMHTFAGELAYTFECKISSDDQYLFVEGYDGAGAYIRIIKVRISDWSIVASSDIAFAGQNYGDGSNIQLSADGAFLYTTVSTGNPIVAVKMSTADLSIVNQTTLPSGYYTDFYSTGNTALSPDGSKFFVRAYDSGNSHAHVVALNTSNIAISTDQDFGTIQLFSIAAVDNTHVVTTDFNVSPNFNELTIPGGAVTTLCTLDSSLYRNVVRQNATTFIVANRYDDAKGAVGTVDISGTPSQTGSAGTGSTSIVFNGNALAAGSVHAFAGDTTGQNPLHAYAYTPGASSFASTFTLANPSGEIEGLAPNSDESHLYCGIDGNLTTSGVVDFSIPSLTITVPSGVAYVDGLRVTPSAVSHTFAASKDTYLSVSSAGAYIFNAVNNGAPRPTITGLLIAKVVSDSSVVTAVVDLSTTTPTLGATITGGMTTNTAQAVSGAKSFGLNKLILSAGSGQTVTVNTVPQAVPGGNAIIPDLSGADNEIMMTGPATGSAVQQITGVKEFNTGCLAIAGAGHLVVFQISLQSGDNGLLIPNLGGGTTATMYTTANPPAPPANMLTTDTPQTLGGSAIKTFPAGILEIKAIDNLSKGVIYPAAQTLTGLVDFVVPDTGGVSADKHFAMWESQNTFNSLNHFFNQVDITGNLLLNAAGNGLAIKAGSNAKIGTGTLSGGTLTVNNTSITANSIVLLTGRGGTVTNIGYLYEDKASRVNGTSFVVKSSNVIDAQDFGYVIIEATP